MLYVRSVWANVRPLHEGARRKQTHRWTCWPKFLFLINSSTQGLGMIYEGGKRSVRCCPYQSNKQPSWTYSRYQCSSLTKWHQVSHEGKGKYSTELWSDEAVHTIQELANSTQPWFLQVHCLSWWWYCSCWWTEHFIQSPANYFHPSHSHPCLEFVVICL